MDIVERIKECDGSKGEIDWIITQIKAIDLATAISDREVPGSLCGQLQRPYWQ
jgi:hypothetical protein